MAAAENVAEEPNALLKIVLVGDPGVGKTSLLRRYTDDEFTADYKPTIGVDFKMDTFNDPDYGVVSLQLWDTAGMERFHSLRSTYYRGAHCVVVVYSVTDQASFDAVHTWMEEFSVDGPESPAVFLIANKSDRTDRAVSVEDGVRLSETLGVPLCEASALSDDARTNNVQRAFRACVGWCMPKFQAELQQAEAETSGRPGVKQPGVTVKLDARTSQIHGHIAPLTQDESWGGGDSALYDPTPATPCDPAGPAVAAPAPPPAVAAPPRRPAAGRCAC